MENQQYIEIDSSYRDRNSWSDPGEFEIPAWSFNNTTKYNSIDPVSNAAIIHSWYVRRFKFNDIPNGSDYSSITLTVLNVSASAGSATDTSTVIISTPYGTFTTTC